MACSARGHLVLVALAGAAPASLADRGGACDLLRARPGDDARPPSLPEACELVEEQRCRGIGPTACEVLCEGTLIPARERGDGFYHRCRWREGVCAVGTQVGDELHCDMPQWRRLSVEASSGGDLVAVTPAMPPAAPPLVPPGRPPAAPTPTAPTPSAPGGDDGGDRARRLSIADRLARGADDPDYEPTVEIGGS